MYLAVEGSPQGPACTELCTQGGCGLAAALCLISVLLSLIALFSTLMSFKVTRSLEE